MSLTYSRFYGPKAKPEQLNQYAFLAMVDKLWTMAIYTEVDANTWNWNCSLKANCCFVRYLERQKKKYAKIKLKLKFIRRDTVGFGIRPSTISTIVHGMSSVVYFTLWTNKAEGNVIFVLQFILFGLSVNCIGTTMRKWGKKKTRTRFSFLFFLLITQFVLVIFKLDCRLHLNVS